MSLDPPQFKRRTGVHREIFFEMEEELSNWHDRKILSGRPAALSFGEQVLLALEFWREYRTLSHIAQDWGVHESTAHRTIERVENAIITSGRFSLPGKKNLQKTSIEWDAVVVDVAEVPCERPKKTKNMV